MKIGDIDLRWLGNASFLLDIGKKIYIDPYQIEGEEADIILITHPHYDHCSIEDIKKLAKSGTTIVCTPDCQSKIARLDGEVELKLIDVGQTLEVSGVKIGAIPAYNVNTTNHSKEERWVGYLLKVGEIVVYHAGDTDLIPEMEKLQGKVTVALLPVGGTYTMNAKQAAEAATIIKPELAIPMHYGEVVGSRADAEEFVRLCQEQGVKAQILEK